MNVTLLAGILDKNAPLAPLDALLLCVIGMAIVFIVLIVLMLIISIMGKVFDGSEKLQAKHPEWNEKIQATKKKMMFWKKEEKSEEEPKENNAPLAKGSCGELKLINTTEREAAMIMAIVADETGTPLNELRFKSIKRVEEEK